MSFQATSTIIIIIASVIMIILEKIFPYKKNQKLIREGFFNDFILYTLFQSYILGLIIFGFLNYLYSFTGVEHYRILANVPLWAQIIFFLVVHDFYIYWFHRWQHNNKYLWRIHEAHHSNTEVDWLAGSRSHAFEILINQTVEFAPIILLGAAPEMAIIKGMISAIWGMYIHSNIDVREGWLQYIINGPEMHRWHHSDDDNDEFKHNFSTKLAIWDWIFGTAFLPDPRKRKPILYGLKDTPEYPIKYADKIINEIKTKNIKSPKAFYLIPYNFIEIIFLSAYEYILQHIVAFRRFKKV